MSSLNSPALVETKPKYFERLNFNPNYLVPALYLLLSVALTWPLALNLTGSIPRGEPDSWQNIWNFWWMRHSLFEQPSFPFHTTLLFYPYRAVQPLGLYFHTLQPAISLPAALLSYILSPALVYNLIIFTGFVTAGWATFSLAFSLIGNRLAAFLAGAFYTFSTFHLHNLSQGQTSVFWLQWIPLYFLLLHQAIPLSRLETGGLKPAVLASLVLVLTTYTDLYYTLYLLLYTAAFFTFLFLRSIWSLLALKRKRLVSESSSFKPRVVKDLIKLFSVILIPWFIGAFPLLLLMLTHRNDPAIQYSEGIEISILQSAALPSLFAPGHESRETWSPFSLGYLTLAFALLGLLRSGKKGRWWVGITLIALIMALGPYLRFDQGQLPEVARNNLPLPYLLFSNFPLINISRSPIRFMALAQLGLSLLAGWGILTFSDLVRKWLKINFLPVNLIISGLGLFLFTLEVISFPFPTVPLPRPLFFEEIAKEPGEFAIFELPLTNHYIEDSRRMYFQTIHHRPIAGGYISRKTVDFFRNEGSLYGSYFGQKPTWENGLTPSRQKTPGELLGASNFRYVVNYKDEYPASNPGGFERAEGYLAQILGSSARIYEDKWLSAWEVPDKDLPPAVLRDTPGFYPPERRQDNNQGFRWATGEAALVFIPTGATRELSLSFRAWSFAPENRLEVSLNGHLISTLQLYGGAQKFSLKNLQIPAGQPARLAFHTTTLGQTPKEINLASPDNRTLAFALSELSLSP